MSERGYIDFHCHLDDDSYDTQRERLIADSLTGGVDRMVTVADAYEGASLEKTAAMIRSWPEVFAVVGAHPHEADRYGDEAESRIMRLAQQPKVIGIGEIGLDFHYTFSTPENQRRVFRRQIAMARELRLPLVIHSRDAEEEVLAILEEEKNEQPVVFHCYTGPTGAAREIIARGYSISISGIVTFKKSDELRGITAFIPDEQLFTETDSPYLSPEPHRGKPNRPDRVRIVAGAVARCRDQSVEDLNRVMGRNLERLIMGRGG